MSKTQLQPTAHDPSSSEFIEPANDAFESTNTEQLLRVAYSIGGGENGDAIADALIDYLQEEIETELKKLTVRTTGVSKDNSSIDSEIGTVTDEFESLKNNVIEDRIEELEAIREQVKSNKNTAVTRLLAKEEDTNDAYCGIHTIKIVDALFSSYEDKTFVFTGKIDGYTRDDLKRHIESKGGRVTSSVSSKTDYLVVGSNPGDNKRQSAENNHHTKIIDESEFLNADSVVSDSSQHIYAPSEINGRSPEKFEYDLPFETFAVVTKRQPGEQKNVYPFIPWYGATMCGCKQKTSVQENSLCHHEIYVLMKSADGEFEPTGERTISERQKRLTNPNAYNEFMDVILPEIKSEI